MFRRWKLLRLAKAYYISQYRPKKARSMYIRPVNLHRQQKGEFYALIQEIRSEDPEQHHTYFRMNKETFDELLEIVEPHIQQKTTHRLPIYAEERLAVTLRLGKTTVGDIFHETCDALYRALQPEYLPAPSKEFFKNSADEFQRLWHFPNCVGALDGKHVRVQAFDNSGSQYHNYKDPFSMVLLALVDAHYNFTVIDVGGYGKQSDSGTFTASLLGQKLEEGTLELPEDGNLPATDLKMSYVIVADQAFPLKKNLMRPFPGDKLSHPEHTLIIVCVVHEGSSKMSWYSGPALEDLPSYHPS
ncbi:hypothetical protein RvY_16902 [Ramazzottius varieornatus]|uniref:DDE Tnp4 domain-containing protein n=1 Tax=Ramazzottius varieornatus TaxID=947166 RepID=A0A1D1W047_RAMVA|nr:hypothetical protein RvY_16902 [Ramazzottius varieornatus]